MKLSIDSPRRLARPHPDLVTSLKNKKAIAIVGSGLSIDSGGPTWSELVQGVAAESLELFPEAARAVASALSLQQSGRLTDAAHELKQILGSSFHGAVVRQITTRRALQLDPRAVLEWSQGTTDRPLFTSFGVPTPRSMAPSAKHRILMRMGFAQVLTTNYDMLLEESVRDLGGVDSRSRSDRHIGTRIQEGKPLVLKLHGDIQHPEDIVLSSDDYAAAMHGDRHRGSILALLQTHRSFWVGCGHRDRNLDFLLDSTTGASLLNGGVALGVLGEPYLETRFRQARIVPAWVTCHAEVDEYIRDLAEALGVDIVERVTFDCRSAHELNLLARRFAMELGPLTGNRANMSLWRVIAEEGAADFDVSAPAWRELLGRLRANEQDLLRLCNRHRAIRLGHLEVGLASAGKPVSSSVRAEIEEDTAVIHASGEFDTFYVPRFMHTITHLSATGVRFIAVEMRLVKFLNSTALGGLLASFKECQNKGVRLAIVRPSPFARDIIEKVGLDRVVPVYDSQTEAFRTQDAKEEQTGGRFSEDPAVVLWSPAGLDNVALRNELVPEARDGSFWIGRMQDLDGESVSFRWLVPAELGPTTRDLVRSGLELRLRFRIPMSRRVCEAAGRIQTIREESASLLVTVAFESISDESRAACSQFASDMLALKQSFKRDGSPIVGAKASEGSEVEGSS